MNRKQGSGITDYFIKLGYNNISKKSLEECGNKKIKRIQITRTPIYAFINPILNVLSFFKWEDLKKKYKYDQLFHVSLLFDLDNMKKCVVEKNEVVNVDCFNWGSNFNKDTEFYTVKLSSKDLTINDLLSKTMEKLGKEKFFKYNGFDQGEATNCQGFIKAILEQGKMYTEGAKKFLYQNFDELVKELPWYTKAIAKTVTDLGGTLSRLTGKGRNQVKKSLILHFSKNKKCLNDQTKFFNSLEKWAKSEEVKKLLK